MIPLRNRKCNRWKEYDYSQDGWYFLTICTQDRENFFGDIRNGMMILSPYGEIVRQCWLEIPEHFIYCRLDEYVIMPNHIHGILVIKNEVVKNDDMILGKGNTMIGNMVGNEIVENVDSLVVGNADMRSAITGNAITGNAITGNAITGNTITGNADLRSLPGMDRSKMYIPKIIHGFKSSTTREIRKKFDNYHFAWQKSYHDHIIRDERALCNIRQYIINNPMKWSEDTNNTNSQS